MTDLIRLLIVAPDPLARAGLARLLADQPDCEIVAQRPADDDWLELVDGITADVVLWDLGWDPVEPLVDLHDLDRPLVALLPDGGLAGAVWGAGAQGLLLRDAPPERMMAAVRAVGDGLIAVDPALAPDLVPSGRLDPDGLQESLTPRETEVLQLVAEGLTNRAIAARLAISEHTVKFHVNAILGKLGAQSRTEAVVRATRLGLIAL